VALLQLFFAAGVNASSIEQDRIVQALEQLRIWGEEGDADAEQAWFWYSTVGAYNAFLGIIKVNRWDDNEDIYAAEKLQRVVVHKDFVTGWRWNVRLLALILFAEWQHINDSNASEASLQPAFRQFRSRHGLDDLAPEFQHGFSEGEGVHE